MNDLTVLRVSQPLSLDVKSAPVRGKPTFVPEPAIMARPSAVSVQAKNIDVESLKKTLQAELTDIAVSLKHLHQLSEKANHSLTDPKDLASIQTKIDEYIQKIDKTSGQLQLNAKELEMQSHSSADKKMGQALQAVTIRNLGLKDFNITGARPVTLNDLLERFNSTGFEVYQRKFSIGIDLGIGKETVINAPETVKLDLRTGKLTIEGKETETNLYIKNSDQSITIAPRSNLNKLAVSADKYWSFNSELPKKIIDVFTHGTEEEINQVGRGAYIKGFPNLFVKSATKIDENGNGIYSTTINDKVVQFVISGSKDKTGTDAEITANQEIFETPEHVLTLDPKLVINRLATPLDLERLGAEKISTECVIPKTETITTELHLHVDSTGTVTNPTDSANKNEVIFIAYNEKGQAYLIPQKEVIAQGIGSTAAPLNVIDEALVQIKNMHDQINVSQMYSTVGITKNQIHIKC